MSNPWELGVYSEIENFETWISQFDNQMTFNSLQGAYERWLKCQGFASFGDNYSMAVQVILVYLSLCIANPYHRRYLSHPDDQVPEVVEHTILQVTAPEESDDRTFWEWFNEENFHKMYIDWLKSEDACRRYNEQAERLKQREANDRSRNNQ